jgi:8-oxo-dGTP pyrophosphatase MutT (NUDIX family)
MAADSGLSMASFHIDIEEQAPGAAREVVSTGSSSWRRAFGLGVLTSGLACGLIGAIFFFQAQQKSSISKQPVMAFSGGLRRAPARTETPLPVHTPPVEEEQEKEGLFRFLDWEFPQSKGKQQAKQEVIDSSIGSAAAPNEKKKLHKNVQVIILREKGGQLDVLVQRRAHSLTSMPGMLSTVGGKWEPTDIDSSFTAVREVAEETGLLDVWSFGGAPDWLRQSILSSHTAPSPPKNFVKLEDGKSVDWWVLLLQGSGTFVDAKDRDDCDDMEPILGELPPGSELSGSFGHAWVPVSRVGELPVGLPHMYGLDERVHEAVVALGRAGSELPAGSAEASQHHIQEWSWPASEELELLEGKPVAGRVTETLG